VLVNLTATVTDRRHKFVTDLDEKDFHVFDEGKPQEISFFSRQTDLPLRIGVLLDTSNSIRDRLKFEQEAAIDFLYNTLRRDRDLAFVMTFDNEPDVIQDFTDDIDRLSTIIRKQRAGGGTAFRDAIYMGSEKLMKPPPPAGNNPQVRRVLVVISDGDDNLSDRTLSEAMEMAERAEVSIYAISTNTDWLALDNEQAPKKFLKTHGDQILEQFADDTGGRVFFPYRLDDLAQSFLDIGNELRSQYTLAYRPADIGSRVQFRHVRVEVDRKGLTVRSRRGYYASPAPPASSPGN
jgi:VWFA-related protein